MAMRCKVCGAPTGSDRDDLCYKHRKKENIRIPINTPSHETISEEKTEYKSSGSSTFPIAAIAIAALVFLVVLTVYGQVQSSMNISSMGMSAGVVNLINLIPLVLVGAVIIGIISMVFRMTSY